LNFEFGISNFSSENSRARNFQRRHRLALVAIRSWDLRFEIWDLKQVP